MFTGKFIEPKIVADIGCTHVGDINRAKSLIKMACLAGASYVKFQKRNPVESVPVEIQNKPHPNERFSYGKTYLEHRQNIELDIKAHEQLKEYCECIGIQYSSSVWDMTSAREMIQLKPNYIKVPSACNDNFVLLYYLYNKFDGDIHISVGMIDDEEKNKLFNFIDKNRTVLYQCTSIYPCPPEHLNLLEITRLLEVGVKETGFSNHGYGIASDVAAYVLGASWIERHFIDDRCFRHTDASCSLEPSGLQKLCRDINLVSKALNYKDCISPDEMEQRRKLKFASCKL